MRSLHCYEPSQNQINFVPLLVQMIPKEDYDIQVKPAMCEIFKDFADAKLCRIMLNTIAFCKDSFLKTNEKFAKQIRKPHVNLQNYAEISKKFR